MEYFYFRTQIYNSVTEKLTKEYGLGNLNFEMGDLLVEEIIGSIWENTQSGLDRNESFEKTFSEFHDRITDIRPLTHGYIISFSTDANDCIPYAWHVSVFRGLVGTECADECCAATFAEEDGVSLIYGIPGVQDGLYLDTEENRAIIQQYLQSMENGSTARGPSESSGQDEEKERSKAARWYSGSSDDKCFEFDAKSQISEFVGNDECKIIHVNVGISHYGWNITFSNGLL